MSRRRGRPPGRIDTSLTCDGATHGLRIDLAPPAALDERPPSWVEPGGFLGLRRVQTCAANGDVAACEMSCRGQAWIWNCLASSRRVAPAS